MGVLGFKGYSGMGETSRYHHSIPNETLIVFNKLSAKRRTQITKGRERIVKHKFQDSRNLGLLLTYGFKVPHNDPGI
eukprot:12307673-Heterocapsa_arctica.AAC.1